MAGSSSTTRTSPRSGAQSRRPWCPPSAAHRRQTRRGPPVSPPLRPIPYRSRTGPEHCRYPLRGQRLGVRDRDHTSVQVHPPPTSVTHSSTTVPLERQNSCTRPHGPGARGDRERPALPRPKVRPGGTADDDEPGTARTSRCRDQHEDRRTDVGAGNPVPGCRSQRSQHSVLPGEQLSGDEALPARQLPGDHGHDAGQHEPPATHLPPADGLPGQPERPQLLQGHDPALRGDQCGEFLTTPRPEGRGFSASRPGVPASSATAPGRTRNV
jgi:hypothetical protein